MLPPVQPSRVNRNKDVKAMSGARYEVERGQAPWLVKYVTQPEL